MHIRHRPSPSPHQQEDHRPKSRIIVAVLCALSGNNSLQFHEGGSCALGSADSSTSVRHRSAQDPEKSQEIPYIAKKDERDDSKGKRKCGLGNSGIITLERKETVSKVCDAVHGG